MYFSTDHHLKGMTFIEVLISMMLALLLMSTLFEIYLSANKSYQLQTSLLQIKESGEKAVDIFHNDIRLAGYIGCSVYNDRFPLSSTSVNFEPLRGDNNSLTVQHASLSHATLVKMNNSTTILTSTDIHFSLKDILIISDCYHAEIFKPQVIAFQNNYQKIIPVSPFRYTYHPFAEISKLISNHYFILHEKKEVYLVKTDIHEHKQKLISGIQNLVIQYDLFRNGHIDHLTSISSNDWGNIKGVAIDLTISANHLTKPWFCYVKVN